MVTVQYMIGESRVCVSIIQPTFHVFTKYFVHVYLFSVFTCRRIVFRSKILNTNT